MKTENLSARAFAPANLSLVFETYPAEPPHGRGSLGIGITLDEGVIATVRRTGPDHPAGIFVAGKEWEFPTVKFVLAALEATPVHVELEAAFPFGCGFGMSGASALSVALAANELLQLGRTRTELGMIAHEAEVAAATGLGDVGGQFNGGIMIKTVKYEPLHVEQLPIRVEHLHVRIFGPIHTAEVINSEKKLKRINAAGHSVLRIIRGYRQEVTLDLLIQNSLLFAIKSELLTSPECIQTVADVRALGGRAAMIMLGEAIVATVPFPGSRQVRVSHEGAKLLS